MQILPQYSSMQLLADVYLLPLRCVTNKSSKFHILIFIWHTRMTKKSSTFKFYNSNWHHQPNLYYLVEQWQWTPVPKHTLYIIRNARTRILLRPIAWPAAYPIAQVWCHGTWHTAFIWNNVWNHFSWKLSQRLWNHFMFEAHQVAEHFYHLQLIRPHHNCHLCSRVTTMAFDFFA